MAGIIKAFKMSVSVVIPAKNRAEFLKKSLPSVANQTTPVDEVLILDDMSTDSTREVVESFGPKFKFVCEDFKNQTVSRNHGIKMAKGEYIAFLDSDDFWLEKKIEEQLGFIKTFEKFSFCYTDAVVVDLAGVEIPHSYIYKYRKHNDYQGWIASKIFTEDNVIPTSSVMARTDLLLDVGCFDERLQYHEDRELWIRLATKGEVIFLDKPLSVYTVHSGQFTTHNDALREEQWKIVLEKYKDVDLTQPLL